MSRLALIVSVTALAWMVGAASAFACVTYNPGAGGLGAEPGTPVHPGSPMSYSVAGLDEHATYQVFVGGRAVTDPIETDRPGGVQGTFTLGNFGSEPRSLRVSVHVVHTGAGTGHGDTFDGNILGGQLNYVPQAAPSPQEPTPTGPTGEAPKPPAEEAASLPTHAAAPTPAASRPAAPRPAPRPRLNSSVGDARVPTRAAPERRLRTSQPRPATAPVTVPAEAAVPRRATVAPQAASDDSGTRRPHTRAHRVQSTARVVPAARGDANTPTPVVQLQATPAAPSRPDTTWIVVALAVLTLLAGGGLGWVAIRASREPEPDENPGTALEIEAELQEIIAEHHAGELTGRETAEGDGATRLTGLP